MCDASSLNHAPSVNTPVQILQKSAIVWTISGVISLKLKSLGAAELRSTLIFWAKYVVDAIAKLYKLDDEERLSLHQKKSASKMAQIKGELDQLADPAVLDETEKLAEAVRYCLKHWERLTQFLREPGIPLSNIEAEQAVRMPHARHRKASLHYKTEHGAQVGDVMMSIIATCEKAEQDPSDYFEAIQQYRSKVYKDPEGWMPWCYRDRIAALGKVPAGPPQDLEPTDRPSQPA